MNTWPLAMGVCQIVLLALNEFCFVKPSTTKPGGFTVTFQKRNRDAEDDDNDNVDDDDDDGN